jgi:putative transferase (TIGR04331 family)
LPRDVLEDLWYRPYTRSAVDLEEREFIKTAAPSIRFVEGNLHKALSTCRLAVLDHLGTTIHFVLAGNVPFVGFWRPEDWALCEEAKPFFARLIDNGVLFECPKDAANQIAAINGNVEKWWQSEPVRSSVGACKYQYARTGPSSMLSMFKTLLSINRPLPEAHSETHTTAASKTAC